MKRKINKYDPVIYPRLLWVTNRIEDLDEAFIFCDITDFNKDNPNAYSDIIEEYESGTINAVTIPVIHKNTGKAGVLVVIFGLDDKELSNTIPHEATHVTDYK